MTEQPVFSASASSERKPTACCACRFPRGRTVLELPSRAVRELVPRGSCVEGFDEFEGRGGEWGVQRTRVRTNENPGQPALVVSAPSVIPGSVVTRDTKRSRKKIGFPVSISTNHQHRNPVAAFGPLIRQFDFARQIVFHFRSFFSEQPYWGRSFICPQFLISGYVLQ